MADLDQDLLSTVLARRLRAARHLSGRKVPELARDLGWSPEKIYKLEQGRQVPDALELAGFARATGQPIGFFFGGASSTAAEGEVLTQAGAASQA